MEGDRVVATAVVPWEQLHSELQLRVLVLSGMPCVRRVCKAARAAFDAANQTLYVPNAEGAQRKAFARAAAQQVALRSPRLTAISLPKDGFLPLNHLTDGQPSGLASRLQKITGMRADYVICFRGLFTLPQCTSLVHLELIGVRARKVQEVLCEILAAALERMPNLTYLAANNCLLGSRHATTLASALQTLTQLQHLHLAGNALEVSGMSALAPALSAMPRLQTLDISNNRCHGPQGAEALCTVLCSTPGLTHLVAGRVDLEHQGAVALAPLLRGMSGLQRLQLADTRLGDAGVKALAPALAALPGLQDLELSGNELGRGAMAALHRVLKGSHLRMLNLRNNPLDSDDARALATTLRAASQLQSLDVMFMQLEQEQLDTLAPAISTLWATLRTLRLCEERLGPSGAAALTPALQALTGLTCLSIGKAIGPEGMAAVAPALKGMQRLEELSLFDSGMGCRGAAALAQALPAFAGSLKRLDLSGAQLGSEGAAVLAPALAQATRLVDLDLNRNMLNADAASALAPAFGVMRALRRVGLRGNLIGGAAQLSIARALAGRDSLVTIHADRVPAKQQVEWPRSVVGDVNLVVQ